MAKEKSLSPKVDELEKLIKLSNPQNSRRVEQLLEELRTSEKDDNLIKQAQKLEENFIKSLEASKYYQKSQKTIGELKKEFSAGYFVDIDFDENNKLQPGATFNIRHTGTQHRHITPVAIVETIIDNTLKPNATPTEISKTLLFEIELFIKLNKNNIDADENAYFQSIVDYCKNEKNYTPQNVKFLIKLAAHLYNQTLVSITDDYISIPHNTNDCYLISTFEFTSKAKKLRHAKEGSFISAQVKILDGFNQKAEEGELKPKEISKVIYTVFSIFDFLPLPESARDPKGVKCNEKKDRYKKEPIERLCQLSANHLLFVIGAYPNLWLHHKNAIIEGFLKYVANGISTSDLLKIMANDYSTQTLQGLTTKLDMKSQESTEEKFTNKGIVRGFATQYKNIYTESKQFFENLYEDVLEDMKKADQGYYLFSPTKKSIVARDKLESDYYYQKIETTGPEIIYHSFRETQKFSEITGSLSLLAKTLPINEQEFQSIFQKKFLLVVKENNDGSFFIKKLDKYENFEDKFNFVKSNSDSFLNYVRMALSSAFGICLKKAGIAQESTPKKSSFLTTLNSLLEKNTLEYKEEAVSSDEDDAGYNPGRLSSIGSMQHASQESSSTATILEKMRPKEKSSTSQQEEKSSSEGDSESTQTPEKQDQPKNISAISKKLFFKPSAAQKPHSTTSATEARSTAPQPSSSGSGGESDSN